MIIDILELIMVIVVPTFAKRDQRDPPQIARIIACFKPAASPDVRGGIDEPRCVPRKNDAKTNPP